MDKVAQPFLGRFALMLLLSVVSSLACGQQIAQVASIASQQTPPPIPVQHPIDSALKKARASLQSLQTNIDDYTAMFVKRCRVDGELPPMQFAHVKIRNRKVSGEAITTPMSVYLDFRQPADVKGREVVWVEGQNDGDMIVHQAGLAGLVNLNLDPTGYLAMRGQRYPITDIGIESLLEKIIQTGERDRLHDECEVQFFRNAKIRDTTCTMVQITHPIPRPHFDFHLVRVYFSDRLNVPIRYEAWSWPESSGGEPVLLEEYNYLDLKVNVGLSNLDFAIDNPAYRFK